MDNRGQMADMGQLIALLIIIAVGAVITYEITGVARTSGEDMRTLTVDNTTDYVFSNGTEDTIEWDNWQENLGGVAEAEDNVVFTGENVAIWCRDNYQGWDNGIIADNVALDLNDGVSSAIVSFKYWFAENQLMDTVAVELRIDNGNDNMVVFRNDNVENQSAYVSVENDLTELINWTDGTTYTIYLRAEFEQVVDTTENTIEARGVVYFDDAQLVITTYSASTLENVIDTTESKADTTFSLLTILAIVIVAAVIIGVVIRAIGGVTGGGIGPRGAGPGTPPSPPPAAPPEEKPAL